MLPDLFKKPQKAEHENEHSFVLWLRKIIIIVFLMILAGSFAVMCVRMSKENPSISTTFTSIDSILAPSIYLSFAYKFNISCLIYYDYAGKNETSCDEYVTQPNNTGDKDYPYGGNFSPKKVKLTRYDDIGPYFVYLDINIIDPTFNNLTESFFRMNLYDTENDYVIYNIESMNKIKSGSMTPFEESLFYLNKYTLTGGYLYKLGFSKKIRRILSKPILSYIGFPSSYDSKPYIESNIQSVPAASLNATHLRVRLSPRNFILEEEQEQRNDNILAAVGIIAAYYSSIVFIYVFLFGVDSMKPWGLIHSGCCGLPTFVDQDDEQNEPNEPNEPNEQVLNIESMDERVKELEKILKCIVNDTRKNRSNSNKNNNSSGSSIYSNSTNDNDKLDV
ncbi:hypothetical protein RhiirA1_529563 [Rhizophagus irregularis]|uniref:Uncharacterized protein n=1 Tax=Rhizophagus irregularis TaxID=588596 RepID=A0A2N0SFY0_9GLOM|nr:hypothetical protein RhiirA1_529563 [Rhizophagus irregularis]CAB4487843.1 unnamed protein product [Rhizophagus irregularis]